MTLDQSYGLLDLGPDSMAASQPRQVYGLSGALREVDADGFILGPNGVMRGSSGQPLQIRNGLVYEGDTPRYGLENGRIVDNIQPNSLPVTATPDIGQRTPVVRPDPTANVPDDMPASVTARAPTTAPAASGTFRDYLLQELQPLLQAQASSGFAMPSQVYGLSGALRDVDANGFILGPNGVMRGSTGAPLQIRADGRVYEGDVPRYGLDNGHIVDNLSASADVGQRTPVVRPDPVSPPAAMATPAAATDSPGGHWERRGQGEDAYDEWVPDPAPAVAAPARRSPYSLDEAQHLANYANDLGYSGDPFTRTTTYGGESGSQALSDISGVTPEFDQWLAQHPGLTTVQNRQGNGGTESLLDGQGNVVATRALDFGGNNWIDQVLGVAPGLIVGLGTGGLGLGLSPWVSGALAGAAAPAANAFVTGQNLPDALKSVGKGAAVGGLLGGLLGQGSTDVPPDEVLGIPAPGNVTTGAAPVDLPIDLPSANLPVIVPPTLGSGSLIDPTLIPATPGVTPPVLPIDLPTSATPIANPITGPGLTIDTPSITPTTGGANYGLLSPSNVVGTPGAGLTVPLTPGVSLTGAASNTGLLISPTSAAANVIGGNLGNSLLGTGGAPVSYGLTTGPTGGGITTGTTSGFQATPVPSNIGITAPALGGGTVTSAGVIPATATATLGSGGLTNAAKTAAQLAASKTAVAANVSPIQQALNSLKDSTQPISQWMAANPTLSKLIFSGTGAMLGANSSPTTASSSSSTYKDSGYRPSISTGGWQAAVTPRSGGTVSRPTPAPFIGGGLLTLPAPTNGQNNDGIWRYLLGR